MTLFFSSMLSWLLAKSQKGLYQSVHIGLFQSRKGVLSVRGVIAQWNSPGKERGYICQSTLDYSQKEKGFYQSEHIGIVQATFSYVT